MGRLIVTKNTMQQWIAEGRGIGHGHVYRPWIQITTRGSPSLGRLKFFFVPQLSRYIHLLSAGEFTFFKLLLYLGAVDLREQFPLWLWKHPHPLYIHPRFEKKRMWSSGILAHAAKMGLKLPRYQASKIIYTPTTDILATIQVSRAVRAVAFSVKPDPTKSPLTEWDAAKLAVQQQYHGETETPWHLVSANKVSDTLNNNLSILIRYSSLDPQLMAMQERFGKVLQSCLSESSSLRESLAYSRKKMSIDCKLGNVLFHRCLWFRTINVDIRHAWLMSVPPTLTDGTWIANTRNCLFQGE